MFSIFSLPRIVAIACLFSTSLTWAACPAKTHYPCAGTGDSVEAQKADLLSLSAVGGVYHTEACNEHSDTNNGYICDPKLPSKVERKKNGKFSSDYNDFRVGPDSSGGAELEVNIQKGDNFPQTGKFKDSTGNMRGYMISECTFECFRREL